jgi:hypothetical protein
MVKKTIVGTLLLLVFLGNSPIKVSAGNYISVEELTEVFKTKNIELILDSLRVIRRMQNKGEVLFFLKDLWEMKESKYPELDWEIINKDVVKIAIVKTLVTAKHMGKIRINTNKMRDYALSLIHGDDHEVVSETILTLGYINDQRDVDTLVSIAKQQQRETFGMSIIALSLMCNTSAQKAMLELENYIMIKEYKSFLIKERQRAEKGKRRGNCIGR